MFLKKKKNYSEVSENNLNINSDYFNIFQNELKNIFNDNSINNNPFCNHENSDVNKNICTDILMDKMIDKPTKPNNSDTFNKFDKLQNYKNIELNDNDVFFINLINKHMKMNKKN